MLSDEQAAMAKLRVYGMQFVAVAMFAGTVFFVAIISSIGNWQLVYEPIKMLNLIAAGTAIVMYGIAFAAPMLFPRVPGDVAKPKANSSSESDASSSDRSDENSADLKLESKAIKGILALITTEIVVRYALLQGGIFLNVMVYMLEPRMLTVVIGCIGLIFMLCCFPLRHFVVNKLRDRFDEWQQG